MKTTKILIAALTIAVGFSACKSGGFDKTDSGLLYKMHTKKDGAKPQIGDVLVMNMIYKTDHDSVLFSTYKQGQPVRVPLEKPSFKGGLEEGFAMLSVGDSATFKVSADSIFNKTFHMSQMPPFIKKGTLLTFEIKLEKLQNKAEIDAEMNAKRAAAMKAAEERKGKESGEIDEYIKTNKINVKPTASGIYVIVNKPGKGAQAEDGKTVRVEYTGKFLDGKVFDTSVGKGQPFEFKLGQGMVIPGWEESIKTMKEGGKSTFVIPSALAYGANGAADVIPPYTPLVFEVELISVK